MIMKQQQLVICLAAALGFSLGNAATLRGGVLQEQSERNLEYVWPPPFLDEYKAAFPEKKIMKCNVFLEDKGVTDPPEEGRGCHRRVKVGPFYSCLVGQQVCESTMVPTTKVHPNKICDCDTAKGKLTCIDPCKNEVGALSISPPIAISPILGEDARPDFDSGTWNGSLDLDAGFGERGTKAPDGIANDISSGGGGLLLPGSTQERRTSWPEFEGKKCSDAAAVIAQDIAVYEVNCLPYDTEVTDGVGAVFSTDFNPHRVQIFYDMHSGDDERIIWVPSLG